MADTLQPVINMLKKSIEDSKKILEDGSKETSKNITELGDALSQNADKIGNAMVKTDETLEKATAKVDGKLSGFADKMTAGGKASYESFKQGLTKSALMDGDKLWGEIGKKIPDVEFSKSFKNIGDALNELTGFDLNKVVKDATDKIKAGWQIATAPFTLLNDAVKKVSGFFGKEIDLLGKAQEAFKFAMGKLGKGFKKLSGYLVKQAFFLGKMALQFLASATMFILRGLAQMTFAFLRITAQMAIAIAGFIFQGMLMVGGLISTGISMAMTAATLIAANAPIIGIALLIAAGVAALVLAGMFIYNKFIENKDYIFAKFKAVFQKVGDIISGITGFFTGIWQKISDFIREKFLKIKSFLGLTSDEEEKELEQIKARKAKEKENKEKANQMAMQELAQDEEFQNASTMEKAKMLAERSKQHFAKLDQQAKFDEMDTQALLDERKAKQEELKGKQDAIDARNAYIFEEKKADSDAITAEQERIAERRKALDESIERDMEISTVRQNGVILEGEAKRQFLLDMQKSEREGLVASEEQLKAQEAANQEKYAVMEEKASLGILRDEEGNMVGGDAYAYVSQERLQGQADELSSDVNAMQSSLTGREDYVAAREITDEEVALTMGYDSSEIEAAKQLMAENETFNGMGLIDTLEQAADLGLTKFSDRGMMANEDIYASEDVARTELSGMQDTTTRGQEMASQQLDKSRFELQKQRQDAQLEEMKMYNTTDPKNTVFQNNQVNNMSSMNRMEDPQAVNRRAAASAGNDYDDLGF